MRDTFFGPHLLLDLGECNNILLADQKLVYDLLYNIPEQVGMTRISEPNVFYYTGRVPEDHGVTGVVVLAESHCSIHTFQEKGHCFIDLFSCKDFDANMAVELFSKAFEAKSITHRVVERGKGYPR